ncbi:MAG: glycosyltransferase [Planctomycetes bacterium]|nr:glycosyltransferase [Planctomycetota bacterium]
MIRTGKIKTDWQGRFGRTTQLGPKDGKRLLIHTVSVGEVNAIEQLTQKLTNNKYAPQIIISTTTDTGFARAKSFLGDRFKIVRYPFDFSFCVSRFLKSIEPDAVALFELEVWPNFTAACQRRGIAICVVNGRLSQRSFNRYKQIRSLVKPSFNRLAFAAVQSQTYAKRFEEMGVNNDLIHVTGSMKWDAAKITDHVDGADDLAQELGIDRNRPLIVAGSTAPGEHELFASCIPGDIQLLCAPRKPEWFDQAAASLPGCARRSKGTRGSPTGRFLLDSIGELRQAYALADIIIVGRSFVDLYGSNVSEAVALGKATVIGPAVSDFQDSVDALVNGDGIIQTTRDDLADVLRELLDNPNRREQLAANARDVIQEQQGATDRNANLVIELLYKTSRV